MDFHRRLLEMAKQAVLVALPVRWWAEVVEVPVLISSAFFLAQVILGRLHDILPLGGYAFVAAKEAAVGGSAPGG